MLLLPLLGFAFIGGKYYRTPSEKDVDHAADALEIDAPERHQMHGYYRLERVQDRAANIKLLKALGVFFLKCLAIGLVAWACLQTWTERIPK